MEKVNENEKKIITFQLGRKPENLLGVASYCPFNKPAVLLTAPYRKETGVFPTTYWLSCPYLVKEIGELEDEGLIGELTERLKSDEEFRKEMDRAHERYARKRFALLDQDELPDIKQVSSDILNVIKQSGVGGIRDKGGIKCLHTHLADYLIDNKNPIGKIIWNKVSWPEKCEICMDVG